MGEAGLPLLPFREGGSSEATAPGGKSPASTLTAQAAGGSLGALVVAGSVGTRQAESKTVDVTDDSVKCEPGG